MILPKKTFFSKHKNKAEFKCLDDSKVLSSECKFQLFFDFKLNGEGQEPSQAELQILQLEPARLGRITSNYVQ